MLPEVLKVARRVVVCLRKVFVLALCFLQCGQERQVEGAGCEKGRAEHCKTDNSTSPVREANAEGVAWQWTWLGWLEYVRGGLGYGELEVGVRLRLVWVQ